MGTNWQEPDINKGTWDRPGGIDGDTTSYDDALISYDDITIYYDGFDGNTVTTEDVNFDLWEREGLFYLTDESGDYITTEGGDYIIVETTTNSTWTDIT